MWLPLIIYGLLRKLLTQPYETVRKDQGMIPLVKEHCDLVEIAKRLVSHKYFNKFSDIVDIKIRIVKGIYGYEINTYVNNMFFHRIDELTIYMLYYHNFEMGPWVNVDLTGKRFVTIIPTVSGLGLDPVNGYNWRMYVRAMKTKIIMCSLDYQWMLENRDAVMVWVDWQINMEDIINFYLE